MAPSKTCFNSDCTDRSAEPSRKGWPFRSGDFAMLCHRCASAFEDGKFCETFHTNVAGWRNCETCRKPLHCGCIVSAQEYILLDGGGIKCTTCELEKPNMALHQISPPSVTRPIPDIFKELSVKNWNAFVAPSAVSGQLWQSPNITNLATAQPELHQWMTHDLQRTNDIDKLVSGGSDTTIKNEVGPECALKASVAGMPYSLHPNSCVNTSVQSSATNNDQLLQHFEMPLSYRPPDEPYGPTRVSGIQPQRQTAQPLLSKQSHVNSQNGVESSGETQMRNGKPRGDARGRNQSQIPLPRYWPKITDQELQQISGDSNAIITPLFEKVLSASDAGRIGRLVLPKKCAEAYLPPISQPEGIPLEVQDLKGNRWTFQFRFWPNNNSRMYVLEGVTPCIQSMQLQAGDTVTFSRLKPDGKLVMGFRKVSYVPPSDQDNQTLKAGSSVSANAEVNVINPANTWSRMKKTGCIAKEALAAESSLTPSKRKGSSLGSRSKRLQVENGDVIILNLNRREAQGLMRITRSYAPHIVVCEGNEIEEHEECPILGRPTIFAEDGFGEKIQWVQCEDCSKWRKLPTDALLPAKWTCSGNMWDKERSSCSSDQELTEMEFQKLINLNDLASSEKIKAVKKEPDAVEGSEGLDTLANLAIMGEGAVLPPSQPPTTKHPRHKPGCSCIVCIQPPSGQFPKHSDTCLCNACLIVKRRFRTLTERRGKRQLESETETRLQKQHQPEKMEPIAEPLMGSNLFANGLNQKIIDGTADDNTNQKVPASVLKGGIDLNIRPERDDDPFLLSESGNMTRPPRDGREQYLKQMQSGDPSHQYVDQIEPSAEGSGGNKLKSDVFHGGS